MQQIERYVSSLTDDSRYRLLVEAVADYAIYMLTPEGVVASWNRGAERFKGYAPHEIIGKHFSRFYTEEDRLLGLPARALETSVRDGKFEGEGWHVRKDGTQFWAHVVIDPIHDPRGRLVGFAKITRDLTERKHASEELKRSENQFRLLVQSVTDYAIYMLDPEGRITNWNIGAERLKGYRPEEIIGEHYSRFYTEEDRAQGAPQRNLRIAEQEGRFEKEGWRIRKDGTRFWANVVIDPVRDGDGKLVGYAKITRDFTERRNAQQALEAAREALFQSQKIEAIGQLTGGVAHDFNNLLMAILASLALVRKRVPEDPRITPLLDNALLAGQRGVTLTQRMLAFARRQKLIPQPTDLPTLVHGMRPLLQRSLSPSIRIETRFPLALPPALVDPNQLESALLNLALNARDAMPDGGPIIIAAQEIKTGCGTKDESHHVRLSVTDQGEGMDDETLLRAVEPFFTTKGVGKGTGLGLSMVQGLAHQSNGRLVIKSNKGQGTTVEIWLPVAAGPVVEAPVATPPQEEQRTEQPLVVLAVDDDALVLMNTGAMLEDLGHTALTANSGAEAMEILARGTPVDMVVTDQAMPHMTGIQLSQLIRARWPEMPIVIATGYADFPAGVGTDIQRLSKPYLQADLAAAISAHLVAAKS